MTQIKIKQAAADYQAATSCNWSEAYRHVYSNLGVLEQYIDTRRSGYTGSFLKVAFPA